MKKLTIYPLLLIVLFAAFISFGPYLKISLNSSGSDNSRGMPHLTKPSQLSEAYSKLPLSFEVNNGQVDSSVKFLSRGRGYSLFLTSAEAMLSLSQSTAKSQNEKETPFSREADDIQRTDAAVNDVLWMKLIRANPSSRISGLEPLSGKSNYFIGNDPQKWHTDVPNYGKVIYEEVYPGIDLVYYGNQQRLEYDFIVAPGADHKAIRLAFHGADKVEVNDHGDLLLQTGSGEIFQHKPIIYQNVDGEKKTISGSYVVQNEREISFQVGAYDSSLPLVIDPVLSFATYLGGTSIDFGADIAIDANGNFYVTGTTRSTDFPTVTPFQAAFDSVADVFVFKLNAAGNALVYSTYLCGSRKDSSNAITVDAAGNAYVAGQTDSEDFPTKNPARGKMRFTDGFVTKLSPAGNELIYSTCYGDNSFEYYNDIGVDAAGNAYVIGNVVVSFGTAGFDMDVLMGKLSATGSQSLYFFRFGGGGYDQGNAIAVDAAGNAYVTADIQTSTGWDIVCDVFVSKLTPNGNTVYGGRLPGSGDDSGNGIVVDADGNAYVTGSTTSTDFLTSSPVQAANGGGRDAFVTKLNKAGTVVFSTYLGGSNTDIGNDIALDAHANLYVTGSTSSDNFPTASPLQAVIGGGTDAFVAKINTATSNLAYSTYLGGSDSDIGSGIATDSSGNVYVTGYTRSTNFPMISPLQSANAGGNDIFIAKIANTPSSVKNDRDQVPAEFVMEQNYPNPFNSSTTIEFILPKADYVTLKVYNIRGEEMATLIEGNLPSGRHKSEWNASDFASGVYFYTLQTESFFESKKLIIIK